MLRRGKTFDVFFQLLLNHLNTKQGTKNQQPTSYLKQKINFNHFSYLGYADITGLKERHHDKRRAVPLDQGRQVSRHVHQQFAR